MTEAPARLNRREARAERELDEARKAGKAPLARDAEGNTINPHIPQFISKAPWYTDDTSGRFLSHQRKADSEQAASAAASADQFKEQWYVRGRKAGPAVTKYRKGACENCGAMTHRTRDCLERPRKRGARWTGEDIQQDELIPDYQPDWEAKRDHWSGYDTREYKRVVEEYERLEQARKELLDPTADADHLRDADDERGKLSKTLRIREDRAAYLENLGDDGPEYLPKSRSIRAAPSEGNGGNATGAVAADGFARESGDKEEFEQMQRFAWQTTTDAPHGETHHLQANPTAGELGYKKHLKEAQEAQARREKELREKYGESGTEQLPKELRESTDPYVEYTANGGVPVVNAKNGKIPQSTRYQEDVYPNNHSSVFGSYWEDGKWGFACCHQFYKNTYCTNIQVMRT